MSPIKLREAKLEDLAVLLDFEQQIVKAERPFDPTLAPDPISYYNIEKMITAGDSRVVVAVADDKVIGSGFAVLKIAKDYLEHTEYANFHFMYTDVDYRGKGVNAMIISDLKTWANSKGVFEIRLTVYQDNEAAIKAYEKTGFKKHIIEMRIA